VALALVALGSGGVAVFVTQLEAGPVALLAVGLVLLLVGAGGLLPSRLKVGENEAAWETFVSQVVDNVSSEQTPQLADALNKLAEDAPSVAAAGLGALNARREFEGLVIRMLSDAVGEIDNYSEGGSATDHGLLSFSTLGNIGPERRFFNTVIAASDHSFLVVEIRHFTQIVDVNTIATIAETARARAREEGALKALLISNQEPSSLARVRLMASDLVDYIVIRNYDDLPKLVEAIRASFEVPS
jgi:hypothetical protein